MIEKINPLIGMGTPHMKPQRTQPALIILITVAALLLAACTPAAPQTIQDSGSQAAPGGETIPATQDSAASANSIPDSAPTENTPEIADEPLPYDPAATHLPPEQWQDWPVVPQMSERGKVIYQRGLAMGSNPHAFSKVGDCQSIKEVLLGMYDQPDNYVLRDSEKFLQETIDQFSGSFDRNGMAVKGGFNAASVLSPLWQTPKPAWPGKTRWNVRSASTNRAL